MIIPTISYMYIPFQPFDRDPFFKVIPGITPGIDIVNILDHHNLYHGHRTCFPFKYIDFDMNRQLCFVRLYLFCRSIPVNKMVGS